jgi:hypothetical protein
MSVIVKNPFYNAQKKNMQICCVRLKFAKKIIWVEMDFCKTIPGANPTTAAHVYNFNSGAKPTTSEFTTSTPAL